jgi:hypothetical protein
MKQAKRLRSTPFGARLLRCVLRPAEHTTPFANTSLCSLLALRASVSNGQRRVGHVAWERFRGSEITDLSCARFRSHSASSRRSSRGAWDQPKIDRILFGRTQFIPPTAKCGVCYNWYQTKKEKADDYECRDPP